ncbi:hypothetical protein EIP91_007234 [Steccherinum ochraceum]|uniref:Uncharacterized protein n=1 Tax=Steccherinum ochraceum TaxID=92696 RepID=A0A4R0R4H4_9APHY|nr:hypothetical protein EIP91_007234 [Steccherinum ochraceum]
MVPTFHFLSFVWVLFCSSHVFADTEIVNFGVVSSADVLIAQASEWTILDSAAPQRNLEVFAAPLGSSMKDVCARRTSHPSSTCPHEIWVILDLDGSAWLSFSKFTLRISWPANYPTRFELETFTLTEAHAIISHDHGHGYKDSARNHTTSTRRQYARIRLVDTGVPTPPVIDASVQAVPFTLLLEPLYFGVLPKSVIPIISFMIPVILVAIFLIAPLINKYLAAVAAQARVDVAGRREKTA